MKIEITKTGKHIVYTAFNIDKKLEKALEHYFFTKQNDVFIKKYDLSSLMFDCDLELMQNNYNANLELMLNQTAQKASFNWQKALEFIATTFKKNNIDWVLIGSCSLAARKMSISPGDLDIICFKKDSEKIFKAFKEFFIEPLINIEGWILQGFGIIFNFGRIDLAFSPVEDKESEMLDFSYKAINDYEIIDFQGFKIKTPKIEYFLKSNIERKRTKRVDLIKEYINKQEK